VKRENSSDPPTVPGVILHRTEFLRPCSGSGQTSAACRTARAGEPFRAAAGRPVHRVAERWDFRLFRLAEFAGFSARHWSRTRREPVSR